MNECVCVCVYVRACIMQVFYFLFLFNMLVLFVTGPDYKQISASKGS